jgi:choloylglycine hydrolase
LIGHNLDDNIEVPGKIYINKRGIEKESISFAELFDGATNAHPKLKWISKYGSVTYNSFGREMVDGGLNEAGLYVGEMTLNQNHQYPVYEDKPKMAIFVWQQYLLDNYASVDEVMNNIHQVNLDCSFCHWHIFISDKDGNHAIIEFINSKATVYKNEEIPVKMLGNAPYEADLGTLSQFKGYGGSKDIDLNDKSKDYRIAHFAKMMETYNQTPVESDIDYAFDILKQVGYEGTKWSIVFDVKSMKVYFRTNKGIDVKHFDMGSFNYSCSEPTMMIDINIDKSGDVFEYFVPYTKQANKATIEKLFTGIESLREMEALPQIIERFANYPETLNCK